MTQSGCNNVIRLIIGRVVPITRLSLDNFPRMLRLCWMLRFPPMLRFRWMFRLCWMLGFRLILHQSLLTVRLYPTGNPSAQAKDP
jgi:hypothetical protein